MGGARRARPRIDTRLSVLRFAVAQARRRRLVSLHLAGAMTAWGCALARSQHRATSAMRMRR